MRHNFKPGDNVVCILAEKSNGRLEFGKVYTVFDMWECSGHVMCEVVLLPYVPSICVACDHATTYHPWPAVRFIKVLPAESLKDVGAEDVLLETIKQKKQRVKEEQALKEYITNK